MGLVRSCGHECDGRPEVHVIAVSGPSFEVLLGLLVALSTGMVLILARIQRLVALRQRAQQVLEPGTEITRSLGARLTHERVTQAELGAYGAVTAAEYVWSWAAIDPAVVKAAAFSSDSAIRNGYEFAQFIHDHTASALTEGFQNRLLGYVGEQHVADLLISQGHVVHVAESANQPIWDLLVDGQYANVKTVASIASVKAEALAHPHVTYYVPEDAHGHATDNIVRLAWFKHDVAKESLKEGMASAKGETAAHGLGLHIPWITVGLAVYRNYKLVKLGKDPVVAAKHTAIESVGRGAGVLMGAKVGGLAGTAAGGPVGTLIGAVVGGMAGALGGGAIAEKWKLKPLRHALENLQTTLHDFGSSFAPKLDSLHEYLEIPLRRMQRSVHELQAQVDSRQRGWRWWLWPDFYTVLLEEAANQGRLHVRREQEEVSQVTAILAQARQTGRYEKVGLLMANCPIVCELVGFNQAQWKRIESARTKVLFERKQLNPKLELPT